MTVGKLASAEGHVEYPAPAPARRLHLKLGFAQRRRVVPAEGIEQGSLAPAARPYLLLFAGVSLLSVIWYTL